EPPHPQAEERERAEPEVATGRVRVPATAELLRDRVAHGHVLAAAERERARGLYEDREVRAVLLERVQDLVRGNAPVREPDARLAAAHDARTLERPLGEVRVPPP